MHRITYLLPILLVGCTSPPSSLVSLAPDSLAVFDERVVGEWELVSAKPKSERRPFVSFGTLDDVTVTISKESSSSYAVCLRHKNRTLSFRGTLHRIDDDTYMDLQRPPIDDAGIAETTLRPHFFVKCTFQADGIRLTGCDGDSFKNRLQQDGLSSVEVDSATVFTGTSEQLRALLHENSEALFPQQSGDVILRRPSSKEAG